MIDWNGSRSQAMRIPIENCVKFSYACPKDWTALNETDDSLIRHCTVCQQSVYWCDTIALAKHLATQGRCVAIDPDAEEVESDYAFPKPKRSPRVGNLRS
jgi:hypothetical protein